MSPITLTIQVPSPQQADTVKRDVLRAVRATGAAVTPVADGTMGSMIFDILLPAAQDVAQAAVAAGGLYAAVEALANCLRTYYELQLELIKNDQSVTITPALSDADREVLLRRLILDDTPITARIMPATLGDHEE